MPCELKDYMPIEIYAAMLGAFVGVLFTYWFALLINKAQNRSIAAANLRAAFIPAIAQMKIEQKHGRTSEVDRILNEQFIPMSVAIETYRPFVHCKSKDSYQKAWEKYSPFVGIAQFGQYSMRENGEDANAAFIRFFNNINAILSHANP